MKKILFVCSGNTCRSPMAESIFKHLIKERGITDLDAASCGIAAAVGQPMSENAQKALKNMNIKPHRHKARQFEPSFFNEYNLILTMTEHIKSILGNRDNVFTLGEFTSTDNIPDPYGLSLQEYEKTAESIYKACGILLDTLK